MNMVIHRTVRKIEPHDGQSYGDSPGTFSSYLEIPNIILLGDPGSGKTYTFAAAAEIEHAKFLSVRQFLAAGGMGFEERILYLDGLDEFRSRVDDKNAIIEVIKLLVQLGRPRVRLSCRVADWLGKTDLSLFQSYFGDSQYVVLNLEPLNEGEIATILHEKGVEATKEFVKEAHRHGLEELLGNPQTLIMLSDVVDHGIWPKTRRDLYERASLILLSEHNRTKMGPGLGQYSAEELVAPAGLACASILISGVVGISLLESQLQKDFPTYRSVPFNNLGMVQACLMRRAFSAVEAEQQAVSYIHRTIAEFIAAKWLAEQIRSGLPVRRVQSLIAIEGQPAPELRGLHAWLATLLPEHAEILIINDPYGILMYGDPATLSPYNRQLLLSALQTLSETDPWFRRDNWSDSLLGALSGPDMVESFQRVLSDSDSSFHLRSVVLDAIINGPSLAQLRPILLEILTNNEAPYRERSDAMEALLRVVPDGGLAVADIFRSTLSGDPGSVRLRAEILSRIYTSQFGPADVLSVFKDMLDGPDENRIGGLFNLTYSLPTETLPDILEELCNLSGDNINLIRRKVFEVGSAFTHMIERVLKSSLPKQLEQLWRWLKTLHQMGFQGYASGGKDDIRVWLSEHRPEILRMFKIAFDELSIENSKSYFLYNFQRISMNSLPNEELASSHPERISG
ncbi:MAG: hypothetical protein M0P73_09145 [Syntrophobacterales bacterium]|jgi:hypothetical protein|nr:hypothetical protein [Syntrophobacterales bacterium]